jgi:hypothetical protein
MASILVSQDDAILPRLHKIKPLTDYYDVAIHGSEDGFFYKIAGKWVRVSPAKLSKYMQKTGYNGGKVRLISCRTGCVGSSGYAPGQQLATELGQEVVAPSDILWVRPSGKMTIGPKDSVNSGHWKIFTPQNNQP